MTAQPLARPPADEGDPPEPLYASVQHWVDGHFVPVYRRPIGGEFRWCAQWWRHAEAIIRLTALWQSWEAMRLQPGTGTANWLRDHLDHQLPVLLGRAGPFAQCSPDEHVEPRTAACAPQPPGWWDPEDDQDPDGTRLMPVHSPEPESRAHPHDDTSEGQP